MRLSATLEPLAPDRPDEAIDAFLRNSPFAAYQQTRAWAAAAPARARQDWWVFRAHAGGALAGAAIVRRTRLGLGYALATVQRGPIVHDPALFGPVLAALGERLAAIRCCSAQLGPRARGRALPAMAEALRGHGFAPLPADRQPLHETTGIVWLDKPEEAILAGFKQRGRRQIRTAEKAGVAIRAVAGEADLRTYQAVLDAFAAARPGYDMGGQPDAAGQARLIAANGGAMLLAECDGRAIGAHAFVRQADEAIWLSLATTSDAPQIPRGYLLLWEGMRRARALGSVGYDLAGLPLEGARGEGEAGREQFKTAFAPHRRIMPPMHVAALAPLPHLLLFGARQLWRQGAAMARARG